MLFFKCDKISYYFCLLVMHIRLYSETDRNKMSKSLEPTVLYNTVLK